MTHGANSVCSGFGPGPGHWTQAGREQGYPLPSAGTLAQRPGVSERGREGGPRDVPPGSEVRTWASRVHQITSNLSGTPDALKAANILHKKEEKLLK